MEDKILQEISEVIQSSNLNFLFGAGTSNPFLPLLGNIEKNLNEAKNDKEKESYYKKYLSEVMLPNKKLINNELILDSNYNLTKNSYNNFFGSLSKILLKRKNTILNKQANLFTTNIDILIETTLEEFKIEYNDGFSGRFNPTFSLENFKKAIYQRSLHYEHISEIPVINIIKIHGSLNWMYDKSKEKIIFSHQLEHITDKLIRKTKKKFLIEYKNILVVNPEESKHLESVLNLYYSELLRLFSSELEKENSSLFILGFSVSDNHIKEIILRSAKSNPTLRIFVCCSQKSKDEMSKKLTLVEHPNIQLLTPESDSGKFTLNYFCENILQKVT